MAESIKAATTIKLLSEQVADLERDSDELASIRATLVINCEVDRPLDKLGMSYNPRTSVHANLLAILEALVFMIQKNKERTSG